MKNSVTSVFKADPRFDDKLLCVEESCAEPICPTIDNFKGDPKVNKVFKEMPESLSIPQTSLDVPSRASSPAASTRMKRSVTIKKGPDSEATSVNGDKKGKRASSTGPNNKAQPELSVDPLF